MTIDIQQPDIWLSSVKQYNHGIKETTSSTAKSRNMNNDGNENNLWH